MAWNQAAAHLIFLVLTVPRVKRRRSQVFFLLEIDFSLLQSSLRDHLLSAATPEVSVHQDQSRMPQQKKEERQQMPTNATTLRRALLVLRNQHPHLQAPHSQCSLPYLRQVPDLCDADLQVAPRQLVLLPARLKG